MPIGLCWALWFGLTLGGHFILIMSLSAQQKNYRLDFDLVRWAEICVEQIIERLMNTWRGNKISWCAVCSCMFVSRENLFNGGAMNSYLRSQSQSSKSIFDGPDFNETFLENSFPKKLASLTSISSNTLLNSRN